MFFYTPPNTKAFHFSEFMLLHLEQESPLSKHTLETLAISLQLPQDDKSILHENRLDIPTCRLH